MKPISIPEAAMRVISTQPPRTRMSVGSEYVILRMCPTPIRQKKMNYIALACASTASIRSGFSRTADQRSTAANSRTPIRASRSIPACQCSTALVTAGRFSGHVQTSDSWRERNSIAEAL